MSNRKKIFDTYCDSIFASSNLFSEKEYKNHFEVYDKNYGPFLPQNKDAKILDIGCGSGHFLYFLKKKGYKEFHGVDISPQQVDFCKKNVCEKVTVADAVEFLKSRTDFYDVIAANDLIEHIPKEKIAPFLTVINNALTDKGVFLAKTPNLGHPFAIYSRYRDFTHEIGFTDKSLYQILRSVEFSNIKIIPFKRKVDHSCKGVIHEVLSKIISCAIVKIYQYQGFVAPDILSPLLMSAAGKKISEKD